MEHPEHAQKSTLSSENTPAEETEISPEDRRRAEELVNDLLASNRSLRFGVDTDSVSMRNRLCDEGSNAARLLLEKINENLSDGQGHYSGSRAYQRVSLLGFAATEKEADAIADLLTKDAILLDGDRSVKTMLLETLGRIGTKKHVEAIVRFVEKTYWRREELYGRSGLHLFDSDVRLALTAMRSAIGLDKERAMVLEELRGPLSRLNAISALPYGEVDIETAALSARNEQTAFAELFRSRIYESRTHEDRFYGDVEFPNLREPEGKAFLADESEDMAILQEFMGNRFQNVGDRLQIIRHLRRSKDAETALGEEEAEKDTKLLARHFLECREAHPSQYTPTLGIEIEVRDEAVIPPEDRFKALSRKQEAESSAEEMRNYLERAHEYNRKVVALRVPYEETEAFGIPGGRDKFWEFSHKPAKYYATLSREVQTLLDLGLINQTYQRYPLHITIGGVSVRGTDGGQTYLLARALEGTGWSTRERRLLRTYYAKRETWTCKGLGGVKDRSIADNYRLEFGTTQAAEIRTFQFQTISGLERTLRSAFCLGAALRAYQKQGVLERLSAKHAEGVSLDGTEKRLAGVWKAFSEKMSELFFAHGLKDPKAPWSAPMPHDAVWKSDFVPFAKLLGEAELAGGSKGAEFVKEVRALVIKTRAEAGKILFPKRSPLSAMTAQEDEKEEA